MKGTRKISDYKVVRNVKYDKYFEIIKRGKYNIFNGTKGE